MNKIDLTLLNSLVKEMNNLAKKCEEMKPEDVTGDCEYVAELSKAMGLATGISYEASAIVADILKIIKQGPTPTASGYMDLMSSLFPKPNKN